MYLQVAHRMSSLTPIRTGRHHLTWATRRREKANTQRHAPHVESACRDKEDSRCQTEVEEEKRVAAKEAASEAVGRNWCDRHSSGLVGQQQGRTDGLKRNVIPHGWYAA